MALDTEYDDPAYLLGRLWATLHELEAHATRERSGVVGYGKWALAIQRPAIARMVVDDFSAKWLTRLNRRGATVIAARISRLPGLIERVGDANPTGTEASSAFMLGYFHQQAADIAAGWSAFRPELAGV